MVHDTRLQSRVLLSATRLPRSSVADCDFGEADIHHAQLNTTVDGSLSA